MAGIAGAGGTPPPLGLLPVLGRDPALRESTLGSPVVRILVAALILVLLAFGPISRAFTLVFLEGIRSGHPRATGVRAFLGRGCAHFCWSAALSAPLFLLLFWAEHWSVGPIPQRMTELLADPYAEFTDLWGLAALAAGRFFLVLVPWVVLTLPALAFLFELTPAAMVLTGNGPTAAALRLGRGIRSAPTAAAGYWLLRLAAQLAGNWLAAVALLVALPVGILVSAPIALPAWVVWSRYGGWATPAGAGAAVFGCLFAAAVLYVLLCLLLLPVGVCLHAFALRTAERLGCGNEAGAGSPEPLTPG